MLKHCFLLSVILILSISTVMAQSDMPQTTTPQAITPLPEITPMATETTTSQAITPLPEMTPQTINLEQGEFFYCDPQIIYTIRKALYENIYIGRFDFTVDSEDGIVTLSGEVDCQDTINMAEMIAEKSPGIKQIVNKLTINPALVRANIKGDKAIDEEVNKNLKTNRRIKIYKIDNSTIGGRVTLEGMVDSLEAELLVMEAARSVSGIKSVRSKIEINSGVSDGFLLFTTKLGMISDARINGFGIKVSVEDGIIILRGTVDDEHTRQIAINKAKGLAGAKGVISYLDVSEKVSLDDPLVDDKVIISQIDDLLKTDKRLSMYNITATSVSGIVTLSGTVDSRDTVLLAIEKVGAISGVRAVKSELEIK